MISESSESDVSVKELGKNCIGILTIPKDANYLISDDRSIKVKLQSDDPKKYKRRFVKFQKKCKGAIRLQQKNLTLKNFDDEKIMHVKIIIFELKTKKFEDLVFATEEKPFDSDQFKNKILIELDAEITEAAMHFYNFQILLKCFEFFKSFVLYNKLKKSIGDLNKKCSKNKKLILNLIKLSNESRCKQKFDILKIYFESVNTKYLLKVAKKNKVDCDNLIQEFIQNLEKQKKRKEGDYHWFVQKLFLLMDENNLEDLFHFVKIIFKKFDGKEEDILMKEFNFAQPNKSFIKKVKKHLIKMYFEIESSGPEPAKHELIHKFISKLFANLQDMKTFAEESIHFFDFPRKNKIINADYGEVLAYMFRFPVREDVDFLIKNVFEKHKFKYFLSFLSQLIQFKNRKSKLKKKYRFFRECLVEFLEKEKNYLKKINKLPKEDFEVLNKEFNFVENKLKLQLQKCTDSHSDFGASLQEMVEDKDFNKYFHETVFGEQGGALENQDIMRQIDKLLQSEHRMLELVGIFNAILGQTARVYFEDFALVKFLMIEVLKKKKQLSDQMHKNVDFKRNLVHWLSVPFIADEQPVLSQIVKIVKLKLGEFHTPGEKLLLLRESVNLQNGLRTKATSQQKKAFKKLAESLQLSEKDYSVDRPDFWEQILELDLQVDRFRAIFRDCLRRLTLEFVFVSPDEDLFERVFQVQGDSQEFPGKLFARMRVDLTRFLERKSKSTIFEGRQRSDTVCDLAKLVSIGSKKNLLEVVRFVRDKLQKKSSRDQELFEKTELVEFLSTKCDQFESDQMRFNESWVYERVCAETLVNNFWSFRSDFKGSSKLKWVNSVLKIAQTLRSCKFVSHVVDSTELDRQMESLQDNLRVELLSHLVMTSFFENLRSHLQPILRLNSLIFQNLFVLNLSREFDLKSFKHLVSEKQLSHLNSILPLSGKGSTDQEPFSIGMDGFFRVLTQSKKMLAMLINLDLASQRKMLSVAEMKLVFLDCDHSEVDHLQLSVNRQKGKLKEIINCVFVIENQQKLRNGFEFFLKFFDQWNLSRSIRRVLDCDSSADYGPAHEAFLGLKEDVRGVFRRESLIYRFFSLVPEQNRGECPLTLRRARADQDQVPRREPERL